MWSERGSTSAYAGGMPYFLLVYDQHSGDLELTEYPSEARDQALCDRFAREAAELSHPHIEVVVLGAASVAALRRTHARYFQTAAEIAATAMS